MVVVMQQAEDKSIEPKLDVLNWAMTVLAAVVVGLRIYNKYRTGSRMWWDDYIAIVSWVCAVPAILIRVFLCARG